MQGWGHTDVGLYYSERICTFIIKTHLQKRFLILANITPNLFRQFNLICLPNAQTSVLSWIGQLDLKECFPSVLLTQAHVHSQMHTYTYTDGHMHTHLSKSMEIPWNILLLVPAFRVQFLFVYFCFVLYLFCVYV